MISDLDLIIDAAREAGALARTLRDQGLTTEIKADSSPVSNADLATDGLLKARLRQARPDYGWLSEETADNADRLAATRLFVVDPIDGTRSFVAGRPWWSVSIAIIEAGQPRQAVVYAPDTDEVFAAVAGKGATRNGEPLVASTCDQIEGCGMVGDPRMFAHPSWPTPWPPMRIESRNSTAYRMCLVASGAFDATLALVAKSDWDIAAGDLIAREAGAWSGTHQGRAFQFNQTEPAQTSLVCAAPNLVPLILNRVSAIALRS